MGIKMNARQYGLLCVLVAVCLGIVGGVGLGVLFPEEQESIQKEGVERIDTLQFDSYRNIGVFRDNERNVTCWIDLNNGGISCIPGHMLSP